MDILSDTQSLLSQAGYGVLGSNGRTGTMFFEDPVVFGFVCVKETAEAIAGSWEEMQDQFLSQNADSIRRASEKAWNAYSIFLTERRCSDEMRCSLLRIEEDFRGSRKIARAGITTGEDLANALLPLLPLRSVAVVQSQDLTERLRQRVDLSDLEFAALAKGESDTAFARALLEAT